MKRTLTAVGAMTGVLLMTSLAHAQARSDFGKQGQFIISADRLVPLFMYEHDSIDTSAPGGGTSTTTNTQTSLSLLWGSAVDPVGNDPGFFTVPRAGLDYVVVPNVTVGGDIVIFTTLGGSTTGSSTTGGQGQSASVDHPSGTIFGIAPRGGYILGLNDMFSLWLRGGFSYYTLSVGKVTSTTTTGGTTVTTTISDAFSQHELALDLEPQFVLTPVPHLGFTAGLVADIPISGNRSTDQTQGGTTTTVSQSWSLMNIGLSLGMLGYF